MTTFVLIEAGEGNTESVYVANGSRDDLIKTIYKTFSIALTEEPESEWMKSNKAFIQEQRNSLVSMVQKHQDWTTGRHIVKNIEPHWQEWTLIIAESQFGDCW